MLVIFDILRFTIKFTPFSTGEYIQRDLPTFSYIRNNIGDNRIGSESGPILPSNTWIYEKLSTAYGYDPLVVKDYATFFAGLNISTSSAISPGSEIENTSYTRYLNIQNYLSRLIDLTSTKYMLALKRDKDGHISKSGDFDRGAFPTSKYKLVFEDGPVAVLENITVSPRAKLYYESDFVSDTSTAISYLLKDYDFKSKILVDDKSSQKFKSSSEDTLSQPVFYGNKIYLSAKVVDGAYLFLNDTYFPGWIAKVNNQPVKIYRAYGTFRAIKLPSGDSRVEFDYQPNSYKIGLVISLISLLTLVIIYIISYKKSNKVITDEKNNEFN